MNEPLSSGPLDPLSRVEGAVFLAYVTACIQNGIHWQDCIAGGTSVAKGCRKTLNSFSNPQQGKSGAGEAPAPAPAARLPEQQGGNEEDLPMHRYQVLELSPKPDKGRGPSLGIKLSSHEVSMPSDPNKCWAHAFTEKGVYQDCANIEMGDFIEAAIWPEWHVNGFKKITKIRTFRAGGMDATGRTITHRDF